MFVFSLIVNCRVIFYDLVLRFNRNNVDPSSIDYKFRVETEMT